MEITALKGEPRPSTGTRASRTLRHTGRVPAVIYGHGEPAENVALQLHDVRVALAHGVRVLEVEMGGKVQQYLIKEVQYDHLDSVPIHLDLTRVDLNERVQVRVGIELRGTPKGVGDGGIMDQMMPDIEVDCLVTDIPETLHPLVTHLDVGESLLVRDLEFPKGVVAVADPDATVVTIRAPIVGGVSEEAEETEEKVEEPERIGRVRKEEEAEGKSKE